MNSVNKFVTKNSKKTDVWVANALESNDDGPSQKYVRYLIIKAWHKPEKIRKFYVSINKRYQKALDETTTVLKTLIVLHNYFKKGPNFVFIKGNPSEMPYPLDILGSVNRNWKTILSEDVQSQKDIYRSLYTS